jgi:hypothetical protein
LLVPAAAASWQSADPDPRVDEIERAGRIAGATVWIRHALVEALHRCFSDSGKVTSEAKTYRYSPSR